MVWRMGEGPLSFRLARAGRRAWALGCSPHRHPCSVQWDLADRRRLAVPPLREKLGVLREPNRLPHLARARRRAHRLAGPGPWATYPISIHVASDRIWQDEEGRLCCCSWRTCYGNQTSFRVRLGPGGMLVGLVPWAAAPIGISVASDGVRPAVPSLREEERKRKKKKKKKRGKERKKRKVCCHRPALGR